MPTYTVTGHSLDPNSLGLTEAETLVLRNAMQLVGVGGTVTITLSGQGDTKVKGHGALK
jgi:hypothetical protein